MTDMQTKNPLKQAWANGTKTYGVWCTMPGSVQAEFIARQGLDYVCVDYQHGLVDHSVGVPMMQAIEAGRSTPIARAGWNDPFRIMQVLDAGARAVVVPMVNNRREAERAAAACRYPPAGGRSFGPVRVREVIGSTRTADLADVACIVMVETKEGIEKVDEIAATEGVDAIYIGPSDLALAMGLEPGHSPPDSGYLETIENILRACRENGIAAGIQAPTGETARRYSEQGFDMITIASDAPLLISAVKSHLEIARTGTSEPGGARMGNY